MCGIYLSLSTQGHVPPSARLRDLLRRRGPDSACDLRLQLSCGAGSTLSTTSHSVHVTCHSTVLSLRGQQTVAQPLTVNGTEGATAPKDFFCWNGEAWKLAGKPVSGNDSAQVFSLLQNALCLSPSEGSLPEQIVSDTLATITGPYAFAYFDHASSILFYGRDPLGRRALLYRFDEERNFVLASIADASESGWHEVEADGIYAIRLNAQSDGQDFTPRQFPYTRSLTSNVSEEDHTGSPATNGLLQLSETATPMLPSDAPSLHHLSTCSPSVDRLGSLLRASLEARISNIPRHLAKLPDIQDAPSAKVAILFSGGLDCTVLARLSHDILDILEPIDLLNVAFENPRVHRRPKDVPPGDFSPYELCPDRITGKTSYIELQRVCPGRPWRFVSIDIPYEDFSAHRREVVDLIHPHNTEMDLSIASALYFAARGSGFLTTPDQPVTPYTTASRVLLSGLGADELFGGYTRHATAFSRRGLPGLLDELNLDVGRLGKRNLGRDDRVLSNWARETRFPFLDEDLVKWAVNAPVHERCGFGEQGSKPFDGSELLEPGKKVLRCLAWKLGMTSVAAEKKRAVSAHCQPIHLARLF
ncbi:hypothetical protein MBLNU459_g6861t1 [Dothideomycetes sp. NU459]